MMHPRDLAIKDFTYNLPDTRIARYPMPERDAAKLLVCRQGQLTDDRYSNIANYIPTGSLMVFNETKVVQARLVFSKPSGGTIEVFCLEPGPQYPDIQTAMLQQGRVIWQCLVGGARKWKAGATLQLEYSGPPGFTLVASLLAKDSGHYSIELCWDKAGLTFAEVLQYAGRVPLPPYLERDAALEDTARYQTIFAHAPGSVAAPTAGLHFTETIMGALALKNIATDFVTLHVGAGTFMPVKSEQMFAHEMHAEWISVTGRTIEHLLAHSNSPTIAVGTTSLRTLESLYFIGNKILNGKNVQWDGIAVEQWEPYETDHQHSVEDALTALLTHMDKKGANKITTRTRILIAPGYQFKIIDGLVTNFHQPQSTLLLLVGALIGDNWKKVYAHALSNDYRFLSYGDGSLLWREDFL